MLKVAVTGNVASGKSLVQKYMEKFDIPTADADEICRNLLANDEAVIEKVKQAFSGFDIMENGVISRKKLSNLIFSNSEQKKILEEIIHPKVREEIEGYIEDYKGKRFVVVFIPLLFESGMDSMFDKIILISAEQDIRLERLMNRNALSRKAAMRIISSQRREEEKVPDCDFVIYNNNSPNELYEQVDAVLKKLMNTH